MASSEQALRFELDDYFLVVEEECAKVRASEIVRTNDLAGDKVQPTTEERFPRANTLANERVFLDRYPEGVDLVQVRQKVRERLRDLKSALGQSFRPHVTYEILYPITVHTDELLLSVAGSRAHQWELLQSELFDMDYGGDEFFERLDARLSDDDTRSFVFEAYYYCLSDGFGGRYRGNVARRNEYKQLLAARVDVIKADARQKADVNFAPIEPQKSPWAAYVLAGAFTLFFFMGIAWLGMSKSSAL